MMFIVLMAGSYYGPFASATEAADWVDIWVPGYLAPWSVVKLKEPGRKPS